MPAKSRIKAVSEASVIGTGLVALDVVYSSGRATPVGRWAGGTCGNVLAALAYLGWQAFPVARLRNDEAGTRLVDDLRKWGVKTTFLSRTDKGSTPVIIQYNERSESGERFHRFAMTCPTCGNRLPSYKPVTLSNAETLAERVDTPAVFFFDRASRAAVELAKIFRERGSLIVFEPAAVGDSAHFTSAIEVAHIYKYSHERRHALPDGNVKDRPLIEIETLGRSGLRYKSRLSNALTRGWRSVEPMAVQAVVDASGCGDWCAAGIIFVLGRSGAARFMELSRKDLDQAVRLGQVLAAWNCSFEGARGGMYRTAKPDFDRLVSNVLTNDQWSLCTTPIRAQPIKRSRQSLCLACRD